MATQEETMRIVAEVVDKFSRPLRDLRSNLRGVDATPGNHRLRNQFRGLKDDAKALTDGIGNQLTPVLGALNINTLSVGGAISAVAIGLRGLSSDVYTLSLIGKETGFTIDRMRGLERAGERVGITGDRMRAAFGSFARNMKELRHGVGGTLSDLFKNGDVNVRNFALSLRSVGNNEEALKRVLKFLDRITNPIDKQRFLEAFGLPAELGRMSSKELEAAAARVGKTTTDMVADAKRLENAWHDVKDGWNNLLTDLAKTGVFDGVARVLNGVADATERTAKTIDLLRQHKFSEAYDNETGQDPKSEIKRKQERLNEVNGEIKKLDGNPIQSNLYLKAEREKLIDEIEKLRKTLEESNRNAGFQKQSYVGPVGGGGVIPASLRTPAGSGGVRERLRHFSAPSMIPDDGEGGGAARRSDGGAPAGDGGKPAPGDYSGGIGALKGNRASWMEFAMRGREKGGLGLSREQAAGVVGNLQAESGKGIPSWGPTGDGGTAWGSAQWRGGRLRALMRMFPDSYKTPEAQQKFMRWEFDHSENRAFRALRGARTPEEAAAIIDRMYERSSGAARGQRMRNARRLFDAARNSGFAGGGEVKGKAKVQIDLNGFPKGTRTKSEADGVFHEIETNRGRVMPIASEKI